MRLQSADTGRILLDGIQATETRWEATVGLLGRKNMDDLNGLLIAGCSNIHMFFMAFAIDAVFVDAQGKVVKVIEHLKPWRLAFAAGSASVLELKAGSVQTIGVQAGDHLILRDSEEKAVFP